MTLIGMFRPPVTPTCLNSYGAKHKYTIFYGFDTVRVQIWPDGRPECANQSRLATPLFPSRWYTPHY
ncbi:hypothetical protein Y032_0011g1549 [Ancylostoma ceylanicum]|uniref:Uncharacterized protein n=1 Tax=Ancylostoma ceylanicum TaxID=53326 RepID=A0A016VGF9_9BILA|nr:hypothetical protein Y032_0011g1549 [Ancylostoma ceylanicum]